MHSGSHLVSVRGLSRSYREGERSRTILDGVDLDVERSRIVSLLGRSGSGKSTLLSLLCGIEVPTTGSVTVDGVDITRLDERERTLFRRRRVGFVYQYFNLIPTLTVAENVRLPLELNGAPPDAAARSAASLLEKVGLGDRHGAYPDRLSGGEQQRVAVVRALIHEPSLVLADEPTGNLDARTGRDVLGLLHDLVRARGATMILVTHSREVSRIADRAVRLEEGRIVEGVGDFAW
jgi:putative ABC transport system ATP-binding protein